MVSFFNRHIDRDRFLAAGYFHSGFLGFFARLDFAGYFAISVNFDVFFPLCYLVSNLAGCLGCQSFGFNLGDSVFLF